MILHRFDPFFDPHLEARGRVTPRYLGADVYRKGDTYFVEIDAPGVDLDDLDVEFEKKHLTVTVERRELVDEERTDLSRGRPTGRFVRRFFLGDGLDGEAIAARYDKGVLTLEIPVTEKAKPRKIAISATSSERAELES